ncbi:hypothetical protein Tsubulata_038171 [Turnera subulata]|uniref:Uncharacterized protein n=1 Tax=Turnera subulata TaxID=218843 RepID=A0A9Q0GEU3_9ROSI|nr:hypothetical protein Tsubulata_038171 [Turnera subulata]
MFSWFSGLNFDTTAINLFPVNLHLETQIRQIKKLWKAIVAGNLVHVGEERQHLHLDPNRLRPALPQPHPHRLHPLRSPPNTKSKATRGPLLITTSQGICFHRIRSRLGQRRGEGQDDGAVPATNGPAQAGGGELISLPMPTIAAVQGHSIAAGRCWR